MLRRYVHIIIIDITACAPGWTSFGHTGRCYQYFPSRMEWNDAKQYCQTEAPAGKNGTLASVGDHLTNNFLTTLTTKQVWIGGQQEENGDWGWTDDSRFRYNAWAPGQPNDVNQKHIAFNFESAGGWNDENKASKKGFLCQYSGKEIFHVSKDHHY